MTTPSFQLSQAHILGVAFDLSYCLFINKFSQFYLQNISRIQPHPRMPTWSKPLSSLVWIMASLSPEWSPCFCPCPTSVSSQQGARVSLIKCKSENVVSCCPCMRAVASLSSAPSSFLLAPSAPHIPSLTFAPLSTHSLFFQHFLLSPLSAGTVCPDISYLDFL